MTMEKPVKYDGYYQPRENKGNKSVYQENFLDRINYRTSALVMNTARIALREAINKNKQNKGTVLRICDYGAGDGRFIKVAEQIAALAKPHGIQVEFIAYEPNQIGLKQFVDKVDLKGYKKIDNSGNGFADIEKKQAGYKGYKTGTYKRDNLAISFIHAHVEDNLDHIKRIIGNVDMTMCMFGVLSHIPGEKNRRELLAAFREITDGPVIVSVPGHNRFKPEEKFFVDAEKMGLKNVFKPEVMNATKELGDIFYGRSDSGNGISWQNYINVYDTPRLKKDFEAAGLKISGGVQAEKIWNERDLVRSKLWSTIDKGLCENLIPESLADRFAEYLIVVAGKKELALGNSFSPRL